MGGGIVPAPTHCPVLGLRRAIRNAHAAVDAAEYALFDEVADADDRRLNHLYRILIGAEHERERAIRAYVVATTAEAA